MRAGAIHLFGGALQVAKAHVWVLEAAGQHGLLIRPTDAGSGLQLAARLISGAISGQHRLRHTLTTPVIVQDTDVIQLQRDLAKSNSLEELALPVLQHSQVFTVQQTTDTLRRLPLIMRMQFKRRTLNQPDMRLSDEQSALPSLLTVNLIHRLRELLPHSTPKQLADALWGLAVSTRTFKAPPALTGLEHPAPITYLPALQDLVGAVHHTLVAWAESDAVDLPCLALSAWCVAALHHPSSKPQHLVALLSAIQQRTAPLSVQELCAQLGWRGVAQLVTAAERAQLGHTPLVDQLTAATTHILQDHLKARVNNTVAGVLLPRCAYHYKSIKQPQVVHTLRPPQPSKYLRNNLPKVVVQDFTPRTLAPCLRALAALHPPAQLPAALVDTASDHLSASLPTAAYLKFRKQSKALSAPPVPGVPEMHDPSIHLTRMEALRVVLSGNSQNLPGRHVAQLMQVLELNPPQAAPQPGSKLLQYQSTRGRVSAPALLQVLNASAGMGLTGAAPGVQTTLQRLALLLPPITSSAAASETASSKDLGGAALTTSVAPATSAPAVSGSAHTAGSWTSHQLVKLLACLVHMRCRGPLADRITLQVLQAHQALPLSDLTVKDLATLLAALAHVRPGKQSGFADQINTLRQSMFQQLQDYAHSQVPAFGGLHGLRAAAGLACWPQHDQMVLTRVAGRSLRMPGDMLPQQASLLAEWVAVLQPDMRVKLADALKQADANHALLPYLTAQEAAA